MASDPEPIFDPEKAKQADLTLREARKEILARLPADWRAAYAAERKGRKDKFKSRRASRSEVIRRVIELLLTGHSQAEIAQALRISETAVSNILKPIWPFPQPGRDNRSLLVRVSRVRRDALDRFRADMLLERRSAAEKILEVNLDDDAALARRTFRTVRAAP